MRFLQSLLFILRGLLVAWCGGLMNFSVTYANKGRMPVFAEACGSWPGLIIDSRHVCASGATRLAGLADWILIRDMIYSPGDFVIRLGQGLAIWAVAWLGFQIFLRHLRRRK